MLTAVTYIIVLRTNLLPWVAANFPDGNVLFQQDGAAAHSAKVAPNVSAAEHQVLGQVKVAPLLPQCQPPGLFFLAARGAEGLQSSPPPHTHIWRP